MNSMYHLYFFFFNETPPTTIYTLSLHDALPIYLNTIKSQLFVQIYLFRAIHRLCTLQREGRSSLRDAWLAQSVLLFFCTTGSSECGDLSGMYTRPGSAGSRWIEAVVP